MYHFQIYIIFQQLVVDSGYVLVCNIEPVVNYLLSFYF